jgi:hypothetical protein
MHLDPKIITQGTEVTHFEHLQHLLLELCQYVDLAAGDDQIIHVHPHNQSPLVFAPGVHAMFRRAPLVPELHERLIKLRVPRSWCLMKTIEHLM